MLFDIIKNLFITICFTIILFLSSSSFYMAKSNYLNIDGVIEQSKCALIANSKLYFCDLTVSYLLEGTKITNRLITNCEKIYKQGDTITIDYDRNNYLNISYKTDYKQTAFISSACGLIFLIISIYIYNKYTTNIIHKINNILGYISFF